MEASQATPMPNITTNASHSCYPDWSGSVRISDLPLHCEVAFQAALLKIGLQFDYLQLVKVVITWVCFVLSCVGNFALLACVTLWRHNLHMTYCQLIITHLSLANLCFTFLVLPMDAVWNTTMVWYGGNASCRVLNMGKQFAMYISSAVVVMMTADKVVSLLRPSSTNSTRIRIQKMMLAAWMYSLLNSIPAVVIFTVAKISVFHGDCPVVGIPQCGDFCVIGKRAKSIYFIYTMLMAFFIPVIVIIVCYTAITASLGNMAKEAKASNEVQWKRGSLIRKRLHQVHKSWRIATALLAASYLISWGPYYSTGLIYFFTDGALSPTTRSVLYMSSYFYPCIQPFITMATMKEVRNTMHKKCVHVFSHKNRHLNSNEHRQQEIAMIGNEI